MTVINMTCDSSNLYAIWSLKTLFLRIRSDNSPSLLFICSSNACPRKIIQMTFLHFPCKLIGINYHVLQNPQIWDKFCCGLCNWASCKLKLMDKALPGRIGQKPAEGFWFLCHYTERSQAAQEMMDFSPLTHSHQGTAHGTEAFFLFYSSRLLSQEPFPCATTASYDKLWH